MVNMSSPGRAQIITAMLSAAAGMGGGGVRPLGKANHGYFPHRDSLFEF